MSRKIRLTEGKVDEGSSLLRYHQYSRRSRQGKHARRQLRADVLMSRAYVDEGKGNTLLSSELMGGNTPEGVVSLNNGRSPVPALVELCTCTRGRHRHVLAICRRPVVHREQVLTRSKDSGINLPLERGPFSDADVQHAGESSSRTKGELQQKIKVRKTWSRSFLSPWRTYKARARCASSSLLLS